MDEILVDNAIMQAENYSDNSFPNIPNKDKAPTIVIGQSLINNSHLDSKIRERKRKNKNKYSAIA